MILFFFFLFFFFSLSLISRLLYTNANAKSPRSYLRIYVRTYPKRHSSKAQQRLPPSSRGFLCHQHPFSGETANRYPRMKNNKNKAAAESVFKQKTKITFLRNDRLQTHSRLREQRVMRQCDRCTFSAIAVCLASSPSTTAQQTRLRPGAKPHPAPVMLLLCGHGILNPTRLFAFTRQVAVSRQGGSMGRTIVFV